jgi:YidC/Oxa1 family membrane protein insertase
LDIWGLFVQAPLINVLIVMAHYMGDNFGLSIIALTLIVNLAMLPLTLSQLRSTKALQVLQPKLMELQQKYGKDRQKLAQEQMALYKTSGIKPAGCAITMVIQMPVWLALYQAIMLCLAIAPEGLLNLSKYLYSWPVLYSVLPLGRNFLGLLDLGQTNNYVMAILVGASMWVQQKMSMNVAPTDPKQRQQTQMMLWMMPIMFTFLALTFPSGLSMYWVTSTVFRIIFQYKITGWGGLLPGGGKTTGTVKKLSRFTAATEEKSSDPNPEVLGSNTGLSSKPSVIYPEKPSKQRYQPGKDRAQHHPKK